MENRVVATLLTVMGGMEANDRVVVIGATNRFVSVHSSSSPAFLSSHTPPFPSLAYVLLTSVVIDPTRSTRPCADQGDSTEKSK
jgi:hypothetical protein